MVDEATLDLVRSHMKGLAMAGTYTQVFKDQCMFSFDTPESPDGLYVNMRTFRGFGKEFVLKDQQRTGNGLYLHLNWTRKPEEPTPEPQGPPSKLELPVDKQPEYDKQHSLVVLPQFSAVLLPCLELPELVIQATEAIISHSEASRDDRLGQAALEADLRESKYAKDLVQLENGIKISSDPSTWVCHESGMTENLWLNLSTGVIGSGRRNWDGSGGTGAALNHYENTGKQYPLCVKLGTITPNGADVYSYAPDEDDLVIDPFLEKHLRHWGINMLGMEKTDKTMAELEVDLNYQYDWSKITEADKELVSLNGAGYMGLENLGNSCYMNSVLQVLFSLPEAQHIYLQHASSIFESAPDEAENDLPCQMAKLAVALLTDKYTQQSEESPLKPWMLKRLVARNHVEFSSSRQQDAVEYLQHLLELLSRNHRSEGTRLGEGSASLDTLFKFEFEERLQCVASGKVSYISRPDNVLSIPILMEAATNLADVAEYNQQQEKRQKTSESNEKQEPAVKPIVPLQACLDKLSEPETLNDWVSPATNQKGQATKALRFKSFPQYLALQARRYYVAQDWTPKKLDVLLEVPDTLDLEQFRGKGLQEGEELLPDAQEAPAAAAGVVVPDQNLVSQLQAMGFSENGCKRAAISTQNANADAALEWIFAHMEDADFNDPIPTNTAPVAPPATEVDEESVAMLMSMGFTDKQAEKALKACDGNLERAADWIFSHVDDIDPPEEQAPPQAEGTGASSVPDGVGKYKLIAMVSHMGSNTSCGHYVCHLKKGEDWVLYNDAKVAKSENPPKQLAYLYLYRRVNS